MPAEHAGKDVADVADGTVVADHNRFYVFFLVGGNTLAKSLFALPIAGRAGLSSLSAERVREAIDEIVLVDQQPIGRSPRANLLTYTKLLDPLRKLFAKTPTAQVRGYTPGHFSFNVPGGRCEHCKGEGFERIRVQIIQRVAAAGWE